METSYSNPLKMIGAGNHQVPACFGGNCCLSQNPSDWVSWDLQRAEYFQFPGIRSLQILMDQKVRND
jgi:hypothetical protein